MDEGMDDGKEGFVFCNGEASKPRTVVTDLRVVKLDPLIAHAHRPSVRLMLMLMLMSGEMEVGSGKWEVGTALAFTASYSLCTYNVTRYMNYLHLHTRYLLRVRIYIPYAHHRSQDISSLVLVCRMRQRCAAHSLLIR